MALTTTVGSASADSYATVDEADARIVEYGYDATTWDALGAAAKEARLRTGTMILDSMPFRGAKGCYNQALEFPRWWPGDSGYPSWEKTYMDYEDISESLRPTIDTNVKNAQIEISYHYIHMGILTLESMGFPESEILSFSLGGELSIQFGNRKATDYPALSKARMSSLAIAEALLKKWIRRVSGGVI